MRHRSKSPIIALTLWLVAGSNTGTAQQLTATPLEAVVPTAPVAVPALGRHHLAYELHLTNFGTDTLRLRELKVSAEASGGAEISAWSGRKLLERLHVIGAVDDAIPQIPPGQRTVAFLWLSLDPGTAVPSHLYHTIAFEGHPAGSVLHLSAVPVRDTRPLQSGSPVQGRWVAIRGPSNVSGHRRSLVTLGGNVRVPQRFAVDWVKLGEDGRMFSGDGRANASWYGYGEPVRAGGSGEVVLLTDGIQENVPLTGRMSVPITESSAAGNTVVIRFSTGEFATYAHLQPGSIVVQKGDSVRTGQAIGRVGNSGNSLGPHLHFHVSDSAEPLRGEGLPFVLPEFRLVGRLDSVPAALGGAAWQPQPSRPPRVVEFEMPLENMVVELPD